MSIAVDPEYETRKKVTLSALERFETFSKLPEQEANSQLLMELRGLMSFVHKNSSWWRQRLGADFLERTEHLSLMEMMQQVPILDRPTLQKFSSWMQIWVKGSNPKNYFVNATSGSTGQPVQVTKYSPDYAPRHQAVRLLDAKWQRRDLSARTVYLNRAGEQEIHKPESEPYTYLGATGYVSAYNSSKMTASQMLQVVKNSGATNLVTIGFIAKLIAQEQQKDPTGKFYLDQIITFADRVDPDLRTLVYELFGAKICDRYSSEEFGYLAIQCPSHDHLHVLQFNNFVEILDDNGNNCPVGIPGRVVVTSLTNRAMPLIRYQIGDTASWGAPCPTGITLPVLNPEVTRIRDRVVGDEGEVFVPGTATAAFIHYKEVSDFQMYAFDDALAIVLAVRSPLSAAQVLEIKRDVQDIFHRVQPVQVLTTDSLAWLGLWKRRVFFKIQGNCPTELTVEDLQSLA
jgi:phenylacetate-CoA ligase